MGNWRIWVRLEERKTEWLNILLQNAIPGKSKKRIYLAWNGERWADSNELKRAKHFCPDILQKAEVLLFSFQDKKRIKKEY